MAFAAEVVVVPGGVSLAGAVEAGGVWAAARPAHITATADRKEIRLMEKRRLIMKGY